MAPKGQNVGDISEYLMAFIKKIFIYLVKGVTFSKYFTFIMLFDNSPVLICNI